LRTEIDSSHAEIILDNVEQERRRIIMTFPRPGDPKYIEVEVTPDTLGISREIRFVWVGRTRLLNKKEAAQVDQKTLANAIRENSRDPQRVADQYMQSLVERGTLQSAAFVGIRRAPSPDGMWLAVNPATGGSMRIRIYDYRVRYVSKAGLVNERVCGVGLARAGRQDGSWLVTSTTKLGTVIGLP
jgi:hypothetical protein